MSTQRLRTIDSGMMFAPTYELGVVFLFGKYAKQLGFDVELIRPQFPDCLARRRGKLCRIEFEFWASSYANHPPRGADIIICWENDWSSRPEQFRHLEIIDLKKLVGGAPRIFVVGCNVSNNKDDLRRLNTRKKMEWNIPVIAQVDDLVLMYRSGEGTSCIKDIWKIVGPFTTYGKQNREGLWPGLQAGLKLVVRLTEPLTFAEMATDREMKKLPVVRKRFIGKSDITKAWPLLHRKIVAKNPHAKKPLKEYVHGI